VPRPIPRLTSEPPLRSTWAPPLPPLIPPSSALTLCNLSQDNLLDVTTMRGVFARMSRGLKPSDKTVAGTGVTTYGAVSVSHIIGNAVSRSCQCIAFHPANFGRLPELCEVYLMWDVNKGVVFNTSIVDRATSDIAVYMLEMKESTFKKQLQPAQTHKPIGTDVVSNKGIFKSKQSAALTAQRDGPGLLPTA
jgi:hypothetical protein